MPRKNMTDEHQAFLRSMGRDLRDIRERREMRQEDLGAILGWNKDAVSKIERGVNNLSLFEYPKIMHDARDVMPNHPAGVGAPIRPR